MGLKKQILGWTIYDFANTIFAALFITVYFPLFVILKGGNAFHVGLVFSLSMLLAAFLVPYIGALADITQRKKILLFILTIACCIATFFVGFFALIPVLIIGLLANFFYNASLDVYDSFLVNLSTKKNRGWISGIGTSVGYIGTLLSIGIAYIVGLIYGFETLEGIRLIFILIAIFFFAFSLISFALLKEPGKTKFKKIHFKKAFKNVIYTLKSFKKFKTVWIFLLASFLFVDAANTTIIFLFLFARDQIGLSLVEFFPIYIIFAIAAGIGSLIFGKITDKFGHKKTLMTDLILWIGVIGLLYFWQNYTIFLIVGALGGALLGGIWTIVRPLLLQIAPEEKAAELLGYQGLTEKFSGVIGPALFGLIAVLFGFTQALLVPIILFVLGAFVLSFVKMK